MVAVDRGHQKPLFFDEFNATSYGGSLKEQGKVGKEAFWQASDDPDEQLRRCWRLQTCGSCLSEGDGRSCGWCPWSSTCVALPTSPRSLPLILLPLAHRNICSQPSERFELRTKSFGRDSCNVSTLTVLTAVVAAVSGVALVFLAWALWRVGGGLWRSWREARGGTELLVEDEGACGQRRTWRVWERGDGKGGWRGVVRRWKWLASGKREDSADAERRALLDREQE
ncbi:hypothetical protein IWX90DRAFT_142217 [Phyllosticta citrichinensis]|uniref:Uncharacterized protein n=1 Tax=Phyllosticta citrichinensis TaxID=1130410 RepID=A0ABR1XZ47_9PEZI